ncbi:hypothetical protein CHINAEXTREME_17145 [Halobiforma lacisalsi AJ5]|uniref:Uncharacterized protein n=2 Tax=Natronobacterium lacisalsi TaxID=229731 RepID=M0LSU0_NATLA|nr:hypothetical protein CHINAEXTREME_17145 [Halobiforma lacisalsi AJ5]EMA35175.1 hypothetical protein C445_05633 [Halobiforma lacisalsi AJ5]
MNWSRNWNALARTPDGLSAHVVAVVDGETQASACGLESNDWTILDRTDSPVRICGTCANHFGGTGPRPVALEESVTLPVDGVDVSPIGTSATLTDAYSGGKA